MRKKNGSPVLYYVYIALKKNYNFKEWRTIIVSMYKLSSSSVKWDKKKMQRSQYMYKIIYEK